MLELDGIIVTIAGDAVANETIAAAITPHVLAITTTLPDQATTLTSTYTGHPRATHTHACHLALTPAGAQLQTGDHDAGEIPVEHARERCLLDHAAKLHELTGAAVDVGDVALRATAEV